MRPIRVQHQQGTWVFLQMDGDMQHAMSVVHLTVGGPVADAPAIGDAVND
jgi:hypothetical protein